jgi:hypothetical protein
MTIQMQDPEEMTLQQKKALVESNRAIRFSMDGREAVYHLLARVLKNQHYGEQSREQRGIVRRFLVKVSGWSRAQITRPSVRLGADFRPSTQPRTQCCRQRSMQAYEELSGPAVRRILPREHEVFG